MKNTKIFILLIILSFFTTNISAETYFINFAKVLNQSKAGKQAQDLLKKKVIDSTEKFNKDEEKIRIEERELIAKKKILTKEEYNKAIEVLRKKVANHQKNKQASFKKIGQSRVEAKKKLLQKLNPIVKKYMEQNNIKLVIDKNIVLLGDASLEITDQIMEILNKEVKTLNIK